MRHKPCRPAKSALAAYTQTTIASPNGDAIASIPGGHSPIPDRDGIGAGSGDIIGNT